MEVMVLCCLCLSSADSSRYMDESDGAALNLVVQHFLDPAIYLRLQTSAVGYKVETLSKEGVGTTTLWFGQLIKIFWMVVSYPSLIWPVH